MMKKTTLYLLFIAFISITLHSYIHNSYDHLHNSECSVYVLEEMAIGTDIITEEELPLLFLSFIVFQLIFLKHQLTTQGLFNIRAPPYPIELLNTN